MKVEILNSELVYQGRVFNVHKERISLPNGKQPWLDIVVHSGAVTLIPFDEQGHVWFVRQYRHPAGKELLELPAGAMEAGEQPEETAGREIREEIGMAAGKLQSLGEFYLAPGYSTEFMHVFLATDLYPDRLPGDDDELIRIEKLPFKHALEMARSGQIQDAKSLAALFFAQKKLG